MDCVKGYTLNLPVYNPKQALPLNNFQEYFEAMHGIKMGPEIYSSMDSCYIDILRYNQLFYVF